MGQTDIELPDGLFAAPLDADLSTPGAGPSGTTQASLNMPSMPNLPDLSNMSTNFSGMPSGSGSLPSPTGTGLTGLQNFLESLGPPQANDIPMDGMMSGNAFDGSDLFGGFGNLLGFGTTPAPNFNQSMPYAHIEPTDPDLHQTNANQSTDDAFNELGAELIASHQTIARPHQGLLLADDEEDDIDPEGLLAEVERSMRSIRLDGVENISDLYDFYLMFFSRLVFEPVRIYQNLASVLLERFQTSDVMRHSMLSIAFLYRSLYDKSASPIPLQAHAEKLHQMASQQVQLDIKNPNLSPAVKLSSLMEVLFYEYSSGGCDSYYQLLQQAQPFVRALMGGDIIDFMSLRGKETFDIRVFAWCDILSAMALSRPTLFTYETDIEPLLVVDPDARPQLPTTMTALRDMNVSPEEKRARAEAIENSIRAWQARPSQTSNSFLKVVRMSAQEIWRHSMILFLYHAIFKVGPLHRAVKDAVRQIISLAQTIPAGRNPDIFLPVPYFLAGAVSISRKDRMFLRSRLLGCGKERALLDLVAVLDSVWKEMDTTGNSVDWSARAPPVMFQL
ncbi:Fungal specific transcription factor domain [Ceratobasidium sp. AG-Ba]|nr:Fungal specific transcription factor domain [Ceratobasidium sp. AG-Ba]